MTTLTVDGSDSPVELNADEQESLAIGEEMQQEQETLLAGKYKSTEDLESAYIELQKKLGDSQKSEPEQQEATDQQAQPEGNFLDTLWKEAQSEYTQDTLKQLEGMSSRDLAQMHLEYRSQNNSEPREFTQDTIDKLQGVVGGAENYSNMVEWAGSNLSEQEVSMFDQVMEAGNPNAAYFAISSLAQRYQDSIGFDGKMLTGKAASSKSKGFKSQAELVSAMSDPRYDTDPAYRQELMEQLENSDVDF